MAIWDLLRCLSRISVLALFLVLCGGGVHALAEVPGLEMAAGQASPSAWSVDPATGALLIDIPLQQVPGEIPIRLHMRYSGSHTTTECLEVVHGGQEGETLKSRECSKDPGGAQVDFVPGILDPDRVPLAHWAIFEIQADDLYLDWMFGLKRITWDDPQVKCHRGGQVFSYRATSEGLGSWKELARSLEPEGFFNGEVDDRYTIYFDNHQAHVYKRIRWRNGGEKHFPILWMDRFGHKVTFEWHHAEIAASCLGQEQRIVQLRKVRVAWVRAVNDHGLGLQAMWRWREIAPWGVCGEEEVFQSDAVGFQAPSVAIRGHLGYQAYRIRTHSNPREEGGEVINDGRGIPPFMPASILLCSPEQMPRQGHELFSRLWSQHGGGYGRAADSKPWAEPVEWHFRYGSDHSKLASVTDPRQVTTQFEFQAQTLYTPMGSSSPDRIRKSNRLAKHVINSVRSAESTDALAGSRYLYRWSRTFPEAVPSKVYDQPCWVWPVRSDGGEVTQAWTATLTESYGHEANPEESERHWVFAGPPWERHHIANAAVLEEEFRSGNRVWARRRNTLSGGGIDGSLSLVSSSLHSMDGRPDVREDFSWDVTGSRLLRHSLWVGGHIWEVRANRFEAEFHEADPGRLRSHITQRRVGKELLAGPRYDLLYHPSGLLHQELKVGADHDGLGGEASGATPAGDGGSGAAQVTWSVLPGDEDWAGMTPSDPSLRRRQPGMPLPPREGGYRENEAIPFRPDPLPGQGYPFPADDGRKPGEAVMIVSHSYDPGGHEVQTDCAYVPKGKGISGIGTSTTKRTLGPLGLPVREDVTFAMQGEGQAGLTRSWAYDDQGLPTFQKDEHGVPSSIERDTMGRIVRRQRAGEASLRFEYKGAGAGNRMEWSSSGGLNGSEERDGYGRLLSRRGPDGVSDSFSYDGAGHILAHYQTVNGGGSRSRFWTYDPLGRLVESRSSGSPVVTTYRYLREGDLARVDSLSSDGIVHSSWTDPLGRVVRTQGPDKTVETDYDAESHPLRILTTSGGSRHEQRFTYNTLGALQSRTAPENGTVTYGEFGHLGKPGFINDGVRTWRMGYDGLGRVQTMENGQGEHVIYGHLGPYLLAAQTLCSGMTVDESYSYYGPEEGGRLASRTQTVADKTWETSYAYNKDGRLREIGYPSGHKATYEYDGQGRVAVVALDGKTILKVNRDAWGRRSELAFASGARDLWTWDAASERLSGILLKPMGEGALSMPFVYDGSGHLTRGGGWDKLLHDPLGRLMSAEGFGGRLVFGYGIGGNNLAFLGTPGHPGWNNFSFTLQDQGRVPSLQANGALTNWFQNAHGDAVTVGTASGPAPVLRVQWDGLGRISGIRCPELELDQNYSYGCSGLRVLTEDKAKPGRSRAYVYGPGGELLGEYRPDGGWIREVIYLGSMAIAEVDADGLHELHCDHLGTPRLITNGITGKLEGTQLFAPYGERYPAPWTSGYMPLTGFTGHLQQDSTGLIYMRSRFYSPAWHRFLNADPGGGSYEALGTFVYADGSPLECEDFTGMGWMSELFT